MEFLQAIGFGLGAGIVHVAVLLLGTSRRNQKDDESIELMRDRNELDRHKVEALNSLVELKLRDQ